MPEENIICPSQKANKFDLKPSGCRCTFYLKSKKPHSLPIYQNLEIPEENSQFENIDKQFNKISKDSVLNKRELKDDINLKEKLRTNDLRQKDLGGEVSENKITSEIKTKENTLRKEESTKNIAEINSNELKENDKKTNLNLNKDEHNLRKTNYVFLKDSSIQTNGESKNCCDNLREEIFNMFENLKEQSRVRQASNSFLSRDFLSKAPSFAADAYDRTFPNSDSSTFGNWPLDINSPRAGTSGRSTSRYGSFSPKIPSKNFAQQLEERRDCLCCGSDSTFQSNENSTKLNKTKKLDQIEEQEEAGEQFAEQEKFIETEIADPTKPEFVKVLIEIGKYTRSLERQLAQMNETMRNRTNKANGKKIL